MTIDQAITAYTTAKKEVDIAANELSTSTSFLTAATARHQAAQTALPLAQNHMESAGAALMAALQS